MTDPRVAEGSGSRPSGVEPLEAFAEWVRLMYLEVQGKRGGNPAFAEDARYWDGWSGCLYNVRNKVAELRERSAPRPYAEGWQPPKPSLPEALQHLREAGYLGLPVADALLVIYRAIAEPSAPDATGQK